MLVREYVDDALDRERVAHVDPPDASPGDGRADHEAVQEAGDVVLGCVFGGAGHLHAAVDARQRHADIGGARLALHARQCAGHIHLNIQPRCPAHAIRLSLCDCGVARAAWSSARTIARRASGILKSFPPNPRAPRSSISAAPAKPPALARLPLSASSASRSRHGLWATPPSASRASLTVSPASSSAAATETRANA